MNRLHGGKRLSVLLASAVFVAVFAVFFAAPKHTYAASVQWINRFYITVDGQNYTDSDTYDNTFKYEQVTTNACKNYVVFDLTAQNADRSAPEVNLYFFFNDATYNGRYKARYVTSTPGSGGVGCVETSTATSVGDIAARKFTFYRDNSDHIISIATQVQFSRTPATDNFKGADRYFRDSEKADTSNTCPDMILLRAADVTADGDPIFGNGSVAGSAILFAVIKDDSLGRTSESYAIDSGFTGIGPQTCHVRSDSMNRARSGEYAMYSGSSSDDQYVLASGLDANGNTANGNSFDDAFITFVGSMANVAKDSSGTPITTPADPTGSSDNADVQDNTVCRGQGLGWIICPVATAIQTGADLLTRAMATFLAVNPLPIGSGQIYDSWNNVRNFANIAFVLAFFAIIFSQATSIGINNYGIKRLLPRLILVAVATNISYFICSFLVDIFNILGVGVTAIFALVNGGGPGTITPGNGAGLVFGASITALVTWAFATGAIVEVIPFVLAAFLALLVVFICLIGRQALIILLVVFSPLAFVAGLLPGTQQWFTRWINLFVGMLVMYPIVMALFAAGRMASAILTAAGS